MAAANAGFEETEKDVVKAAADVGFTTAPEMAQAKEAVTQFSSNSIDPTQENFSILKQAMMHTSIKATDVAGVINEYKIDHTSNTCSDFNDWFQKKQGQLPS